MDRRRNVCRSSLLLGVLLAGHAAQAEQLPVTHFSVANGLPHDRVARIVQDSHGFLWFCTANGLSRFDGSRFVTYNASRGLPFPSLNDIIETSQGEYWIATNGGGVVRFTPDNPARSTDGSPGGWFTSHSIGPDPAANRVNLFYQDRSRRLWVGTDGGLFLLDRSGERVQFRRVPLGLPAEGDRIAQIWAMAEDEDGTLWIGSRFGLLRRSPNGQTRRYRIDARSSTDHVFAVMRDDDGRLWLGHSSGLIVLRPEPSDETAAVVAPDATLPIRWTPSSSPQRLGRAVRLPEARGEARRYTTADGLASSDVRAITKSADGAIWIGSRGQGVAEFRDGRIRVYTRSHGLVATLVQTITEDRGGNIWIGSVDGAMRLARNGLTTYGEVDGLGQATGILLEKNGDLYVASQGFRISQFDGQVFTTVRPRLESSASGWRPNHGFLLDRAGDWWVATREGLYRFPRVPRIQDLARVAPRVVYTSADGLADNDLTLVFEDRRGDIWIGHFAPANDVLTRWERSTGRFYRYSAGHGLKPFSALTAIAESPTGELWMAFRGGELIRYREERFEPILEGGAAPPQTISALHVEPSGRLWAALHAGGGVLRLDPRDSAPPVVTRYTTSAGLSSNNVGCLTQDARGLLYLVSGAGIDRLDPATGRIKRYSVADGVINTECSMARSDSQGALWFNSAKGILRITPQYKEAPDPPRIRIARLQIAGADQPVPALGATAMGPFTVGPDRNRLHIEFFALTQDLRGSPRYRYRLEGSDEPWSPLTEERQITYGNLSPGKYRFVVRAIDTDGTPSDMPATIPFTILAPVWQRGWFVAIAALTLMALAFAVHRARVTRVIELERVRTRIATDLHDDIGSGLSQVAMLTELLGRRVGSNPHVSEPLSTIGDVSRDLIDSMNDIVWAINPLRDHVSDLSHRMRRFASEVLGARDIELHFALPDERRDVALGPDVRREVWLIVKEAVNNVARHAACTRADIGFVVRSDFLELSIRDNGRGFDTASAGGGTGLASMRQRAARLGGTLDVRSEKAQGTAVTLRAPLRRRRPWSNKFS